MAGWQVELGQKWKNYFGKADQMLEEAYPRFMVHRCRPECSDELMLKDVEDRYVTFGINGRKMQVDLLTMIQLRVDNKKKYKICPPAHHTHRIQCWECGQTYKVGRNSDCRWCSQCWQVNAKLNDELGNKPIQTAPHFAEPYADYPDSPATALCRQPCNEKDGAVLSLQKALFERDPLKPMKIGVDLGDEAFQYISLHPRQQGLAEPDERVGDADAIPISLDVTLR